MMRWMPLVFGLFFYTLPSGLVLYMFVNTLLSILQQWYIKRNFELKPPMTAGAAG
jgi:YidC/Oxa1 family membrane protein insertase